MAPQGGRFGWDANGGFHGHKDHTPSHTCVPNHRATVQRPVASLTTFTAPYEPHTFSLPFIIHYHTPCQPNTVSQEATELLSNRLVAHVVRDLRMQVGACGTLRGPGQGLARRVAHHPGPPCNGGTVAQLRPALGPSKYHRHMLGTKRRWDGLARHPASPGLRLGAGAAVSSDQLSAMPYFKPRVELPANYPTSIAPEPPKKTRATARAPPRSCAPCASSPVSETGSLLRRAPCAT